MFYTGFILDNVIKMNSREAKQRRSKQETSSYT